MKIKKPVNEKRENKFLLRIALITCIGGAVILLILGYKYYGTFFRGYDAQMYYAQLRSIVIDGDLDSTNEILEISPGRMGVFIDDAGIPTTLMESGRVINRYTSGFAIVTFLPFLASHLMASLSSQFLTNGYSIIYEFLCAAWQAALALWGLGILAKLIQRIFNSQIAAITIISGFFATNLCYYTSIYPFMTHASTFGFVCGLLDASFQLYVNPEQPKKWIWAGILTILIVLLRPTNVVLSIILLPACWSLVKIIREQRTWQRLTYPLTTGLGIIVAIGIQFVAWRLAYGYWIIDTYAKEGEGFFWLRPAIWQLLFSPLHGGWYFHPLYMLGTIGLILGAFYHHNVPKWRFFYLTLITATLLHIYIYASWHCWWFGYSFGNRIFVDVSPLLLIGVSFLLNQYSFSNRKITGAVAFVGILCLWNLGLFLGTIRGIIPVGSEVSLNDMLNAHLNNLKFIIEMLI